MHDIDSALKIRTNPHVDFIFMSLKYLVRIT